MQWIFDTCPDDYGLCIRQYITCFIGFIISLFSAYSVWKTLTSKNKSTKVELGPLIINFVAAFLIFVLYFAFQEFYNTHLLLVIIEIFSYILITYAFRILYLKSEAIVNIQKIKRTNIAFFIITLVTLIVILVITILSFLDQIKCRKQYGLGTLIVFLIQLPIYVFILFLCKKTKQKLKELTNSKQEIRNSSLRLFVQIDQEIRLKIKQTNLVIVTFTGTMILHLLYLILFLIFDEQMICEPQTNKILVHNSQELILMSIQNISQLFPYLMIPVIFCFIPQRLSLHSASQYNILATRRQLSIDEKINPDPQSYVRCKLMQNQKLH